MTTETKSFRELQIVERLTYPCHVNTPINIRIFEARRLVMEAANQSSNTLKNQSVIPSEISIPATPAALINRRELIADRYELSDIIGEGGVSYFFFFDFDEHKGGLEPFLMANLNSAPTNT